MNEKALIEAILFVSNKPISLETISKISGISKREKIKEIIELLKKVYESKEHGIYIAETPYGYEFRVKPEYLDKVKDVAETKELSEGALKTLALILLKENALQSEIVKVQGNKAYNYLEVLERKGFIRREKSGRTRLIKITKEVENYFGKSLEEIKKELIEKSEKY